MKEKGPKYSIFDENDFRKLEDIVFRARPIHYEEGDKGLLLTILGNSAITSVHSRDGYESIPGATTQLYRQALAAMEIIASAIGEEIEYCFVSSNEKMKEWAIDPEKGEGLFKWDRIGYDKNSLYAYKRIKPLPASSDMLHCVI